MKRVRLSRAFGTTPNTVYRRIEHAFTQPAGRAQTGSAADAELPEPPASRPWRWWLEVLAVLLLALTAWLLLDPFSAAPARPAEAPAGEGGRVLFASKSTKNQFLNYLGDKTQWYT